MGRFIDETGNTYGKWYVIEKINNPQKNGALFKCRCECGHEQNILGKRLRAGETKQCTTCQAKAHVKHYAGYRFNQLTVLDEYESRNGRIYWHCQCDCGNDTWVSIGNLTSGEVKSCGCLSHRYNGPLQDLTSQTFNDLTVIKEFECDIPNGVRRWECQCACGNRTVVKTSDLTTGKVKSCGCRKISQIPPGSVFGKLTVRSATEKRASNGTIIYLCDCECGNTCEVPSSNLIRGDWRSCGCGRHLSYGEIDIANRLDEMNIIFNRNQRFDNLTPIFREERQVSGGRPPEYDFAIYNNGQLSYIIEYDGIQHFKPQQSGWATEDKVLSTHHSDLLKNHYCFNNNIPIIRIPYNQEYNNSDLILETTRFLLTPENEDKYYNSHSNGFFN